MAEGESNASMDEEEEDYRLHNLFDSGGESNASMVQKAILLHAQPDEVVSSPDNALPSSVNQLVKSSVSTQAVSSEPTDAEAQNLAGDSSDGEMNTSTSFGEIDGEMNTSTSFGEIDGEMNTSTSFGEIVSAVALRTQPSEEVSSPDNNFPSVRTSTVPIDVSFNPTDAKPPVFSGDSSDAVPNPSRNDSISDRPVNDSRTVSLSNKPSEISDEELEKYIEKMPQELRIKPVHCLVVCTMKDMDAADKFREHLIRDIDIKDGPVTAVLDKGPEFIRLPGCDFSRLEECFKRSILILIFMTENLIEDKKMLHNIESCFTDSFTHADKLWNIFPVYSRKEDKNLPLPIYLKPLTAIDYFNQNEHYRKIIASLIEARNSVFVKKNEHLKKRQKEWITEDCKTDAATGGVQETQMQAVSIPGLDTDNKKRWHTVGLCLNLVVSAALKNVGDLIEEVFNDLKIGEQTKDHFKKEHGTKKMVYKVINGNASRKKEEKEEYDYNIRNAVDFSKCLLPHQAPKYTDFNESCKLETRLYFLMDIDFPSITADCKLLAKRVVGIRHNWAHCDFSEWTDDFYRNALSLIEELLKNLKLKPEEENRFLGDLEEMKDHCHNLIHAKTCDVSLLQDLLDKTEELLKCVTEDKIVIAEIVKIIRSLHSGLATLKVQLSPK